MTLSPEPAMTKSKPVLGHIHSIETFGSVDGPGIRYVIFLHGCPLRCQFCHNPDTWAENKYQEATPESLLDQALHYRKYWGLKGGITVSGGEPLLQMDFLIEFFKLAKKQKINTVIDTSGAPFTRKSPFFDKFNELMEYTDLLLLDIKHIDDEGHKILTGRTNENILDLARYLSDINKAVWIRHVLVPQRNDTDEYLIRLDKFIKTLKNVQRVEILPYHTLGEFKWQQLNLDYPLKDIQPPSKGRVFRAKELLHTDDYRGYLKK